ncbi:MAG: hypothetical protein KIT11_03145 [Fimbriimonadaceae bacterium]|nr:hypothetical protein [Fimbriimonadaceae bacterium]QYK57106.1 MAG: hypothetical protein KF733_06380 [Fimbriimonadaceae bacterium]
MGLALVSMGAVAQQRSTPQNFRGPAETGLVGINLFDPGTRVIAKYGSPVEIQALAIGTGAGLGATASTSGGGRQGPAGAGGQRAGGGGGGGGRPTASIDQILPGSLGGFIGDPFGDGSEWKQQAPSAPTAAGAQGGQFGGGTGEGAARAGGGQIDPGAGGAASGGGGLQSSGLVTFTRWVYNRGPSRYAFVLDNHNRVIQIEAVGSIDSRPVTKRGICFNKTFGNIINAYNDPDGYEINGDTIVVRYLQRGNVAFRLQRTEANKPHRVTGIVVAAGS